MMPQHEPPRNLPDQVIRDSLNSAANLREFLNAALPQLAGGFDCEQAHPISREFLWDDWRNREADLPLEIPFHSSGGSGTAVVCVLIEHQSDTDTMMPLRALYFGVGYWDRKLKEWASQSPPRPPLKLPPVVPIILYTGPTPWGSNRTITDLLDEPKVFHAFAPQWEPIFWNLAHYTPRQLLESGLPWLQMLSVIRVERAEQTEFQSVFREAVQRLSDLQSRESVRWSELLRIMVTYASWRRPASERGSLEQIALQIVPTRNEEIKGMFQTIADELIERGRVEGRAEGRSEGRAEGRSEGRAEGRSEGRAEGELQSSRDTLRRLLLRRFHQVPDAMIQRIESCVDVEKLKAAIESILELQSLDKLDL